VLTRERLIDLMEYDPETGVFRWRVTRCSTARKGDVVGSAHGGYLRVRIDGKNQYLQRLAWLYMTGSWPTKMVDHKNGVGTDNRWGNLRDLGNAKNKQNAHEAHADSATGLLGASPCGSRFRAAIMKDGLYVNLGVHDTPQQAHQAYLDAKRELHPHATLGGR